MRKRLVGLLAGAVVVFAACGTAASPSPSASAPAASTAGRPRRRRLRPQPSESGIDLTNTAYAPAEGTDGGSIIIGDWQEANQFNPYYVGQVTEANVASAVFATLFVLHERLSVRPGPRDSRSRRLDNGGVKAPGEGGDAMTVTWTLRDGLKWSDGEPLTCDDFKYAWEWVLDPDNVGVGHDGLHRTSPMVECASDTEMVLHFAEHLRGLHHPLQRSACRATSWSRSRSRTRSTAPASGPRKSPNLPVERRVQVRVGHAAAGAAPGQATTTTRAPWTGKPAHLDNLIWKWYGDADLMIAGFKANEIDFATDLQDSDIPKVQDLGDQVSAIPALLYEFLRPNWSEGPFDAATKVGGCSRNPTVQDRGDGLPDGGPGDA